MKNEIELWNFISERLTRGGSVVLLVVADSTGSSPGRPGFKMAVADDGLSGSIGGGVMEVNLVESAREIIKSGRKTNPALIRQEHREKAENPSGMICSGEQTVLRIVLGPGALESVQGIADGLEAHGAAAFKLSKSEFENVEHIDVQNRIDFRQGPEGWFEYTERISVRERLFIVGGGHCALALSEQMSRLGFYISLFDDRPDLNTLEKNTFAHRKTIIRSYEDIAEHIPEGDDVYVVVMTIGYKYDDLVIRRLFDREFRYFGVLGSKAKMAKLLRDLENDGFDKERIDRIRTPIGLPINSRTPEEIAVSIAAEMIAVKNASG